MATIASSDVEPLVILAGSPEEADRFLMSALWGDSDPFVSVLGVCALGVLLGRHARHAGPIVAFYVLWGIGSALLFVVQTPQGAEDFVEHQWGQSEGRLVQQ